MTALSYPAIYGPFIILASLPGGWLPSLVALSAKRGQNYLPTQRAGAVMENRSDPVSGSDAARSSMP